MAFCCGCRIVCLYSAFSLQSSLNGTHRRYDLIFIFVGLYTCYSFGILQGSRKIAVLTLMTSALVPIQGVTQMPMLFTVIGPIGLAGGLVVIGLVLVGWKHFT